MNTLKQGMAAVGLVVSLGLVVPSSFGGSAFADISHNPNLNQYNDPFPLSCDLDGDSINDTTYVASHYEASYAFETTAKSLAWHDQNSNTVMTQHERIDVMQADYVAQADVPQGYPETFTDYTVEWYDVFVDDDPILPKGRKPVLCVNISEPYDDTYSAELAALDQEHQIAAGVLYKVIDYQLFEVKLSASGKSSVKAASTSGGGKHHRKGNHKGKNGKHGH